MARERTNSRLVGDAGQIAPPPGARLACGLVVGALLCLCGGQSDAEEMDRPPAPALTGPELARAVRERPDGEDAALRGRMTLTLASGLERSREFLSFRRDQASGGTHSLIRFTAPANIDGTGVLVDDGEDSLWLYLPALDRTRRISSDNRGGRFVQSQLYYEDLQTREVEEDRHRLLGAGDYEGVECTLLESVPSDANNSAYSKRVSWIHPALHLPLRVDFFEGGDEPAKRLEVLRVEDIAGYWTVTDSVMTDLASGARTRTEVQDICYDSGLTETLFTTAALAANRNETYCLGQ